MTELQRDHKMGLVHHLSNQLEALSSEQICRLPPLEVEKVLMTAVQKAFKDKGQQITPDQSDHIVDTLTSSVMKACPYIRIAEIPIAIENGILGEYGEYFGLNVVTFVSFVKSHFNSLSRANLVKQNRKDPVEEKIPTDEELAKMDKDILIRAFDTYKRLGYYEDHGNYIYRVAVKKLGLFELSEDRKKEYLEKGKKRAIEAFKTEMVQRPFERNALSKNINDVANMVKGSDGLSRVYKEALQLALMAWFKDLVEMGTEITDLISYENDDE